jgi:4-hydroxy-L-threonine phosphate dehydrogenase PdxA
MNPIAISLGDPAGIGPELIAAWDLARNRRGSPRSWPWAAAAC